MSAEPHSPESEAFLTDLRKHLAHQVAQKVTFSVLDQEHASQLRPQVASVVNHYLAQEGIALKAVIREDLINDLTARLIGSNAAAPEPDHPPMESIRNGIASYLAQYLSDEIQGDDLAREIMRLIDVKLKQDGTQLPADVRARIITEMCQRMNVIPPEEVRPDEPAPFPDSLEPATTPPTLTNPSDFPDPPVDSAEATEPDTEKTGPPAEAEPIAWPDPEPASTGQPPTPEPRPLPPLQARGAAPPPEPSGAPASPTHIPLKALTHEIKRELLYHLSQSMDHNILAMGDESHSRQHIATLIDEYCLEHRLSLTDNEIERIMNEILSGEGLEFQL